MARRAPSTREAVGVIPVARRRTTRTGGEEVKALHRGVLIVTLFVVGAALAAAAVLRGSRPADPVLELRERLQMARLSADSCRTALEVEEAELHAYSAQLDSMRIRVREYEGLHPDGVPVDSYAPYMRAFDLYNDSAATWSERADTVRARLARCQDIVRAHNLLGDSLRRLIVERGSR